MKRSLSAKRFNAVRALGPIVEMCQVMVRYLGRRGLFRRCLWSLWKHLLLELNSGSIRICRFRICLAATRVTSDLSTTLHRSVRRKDWAYGVGGMIHAGR